MVGVKRSERCRNCRDRKKACDLARPTCSRCERIGTRCLYDDKVWTFVDQASTVGGEPSSSHPPDLELARRTFQLPGDIYYPALSRASERWQIDADFWEAYLPNDELTRPVARDEASVVPWVPTLRYFASQDRKARLALDSCALMALGRVRDNQQYVQEGLMLYSQALAATNLALQNSACVQRDGVLACCRILALCEIFRPHLGAGVSTQGTDWQRHIEGTVQLLRVRGPSKHVDEHGFAMFTDVRANAAVGAITRRRRAPFSGLRWRRIPWSGRERRRTLRDDLIDVMGAVAGALEQQDLFLDQISAGAGHVRVLERQSVLDSSLNAIEMLRAWERRMLATASAQASALQVDLAEVCTDLGYASFHLIMQHWATSLIMCSRYWVTLRRLSTRSTPHQQQEPSQRPRVPDPQNYATSIARFAHHYFLPQAGLYGPQHASYPLGAALHYYAATDQQQSAGMLEIRRVLREARSASFTSEFLRSMAVDPAPEEIRGDTRNLEEHTGMATQWFGLRRVSSVVTVEDDGESGEAD